MKKTAKQTKLEKRRVSVTLAKWFRQIGEKKEHMGL